MGTYNSGIYPASPGLPLGRVDQEWDLYALNAFITNLTVSGSIAGLLLNGFVTTTYSATPTFTPVNLNITTFQITLTGNVTSSTMDTTDMAAGAFVVFQIIQDATGGRSFVWPTNILGGIQIDTTAPASAVFIQHFFFDGTNLYPVAPGAIY